MNDSESVIHYEDVCGNLFGRSRFENSKICMDASKNNKYNFWQTFKFLVLKLNEINALIDYHRRFKESRIIHESYHNVLQEVPSCSRKQCKSIKLR